MTSHFAHAIKGKCQSKTISCRSITLPSLLLNILATNLTVYRFLIQMICNEYNKAISSGQKLKNIQNIPKTAFSASHIHVANEIVGAAVRLLAFRVEDLGLTPCSDSKRVFLVTENMCGHEPCCLQIFPSSVFEDKNTTNQIKQPITYSNIC